MGKLPYGPATVHVKESHGGDVDVMKFYCTRYGTDYGRRWMNWEPRTTSHTGTGFVSNIRPQIFYSGHLDEVDNPAMGHIVADNYSSITTRSFRPLAMMDGKEPLPNAVTQVPSGYVRDKPLHIPSEAEVRKMCIGSQVGAAPVDILPRYKPVLHKIQRKDPIEDENYGYGPGCMTTETKSKFRGHQMDDIEGNQYLSVGEKEESGFTHNHSVEPVTFRPDLAFKGDCPDYLTNRPTGLSITKTHYQPSMYHQGNEALPKIAVRSDKESGFTNGIKPQRDVNGRGAVSDAYDKATDLQPSKLDRVRKMDPTEYMNVMHPNNYSSISHCTYLGKQQPDATEADRLGNVSIGRKEESGYTENNPKFVWSPDNPARFYTDNMARYYDTTPKGADRQGHLWGGTQLPKPDGFTRSVGLHTGGPTFNPGATLHSLDPYVSRSMRARDQYYDDRIHDSKLIGKNVLAA